MSRTSSFSLSSASSSSEMIVCTSSATFSGVCVSIVAGDKRFTIWRDRYATNSRGSNILRIFVSVSSWATIEAAMPPEPISAESRELLGKLRNLLLEQHKLLLDRERAEYEKANGPVAGPGPLLALVIEDPHFAWLKQISTLVVEIDEALSRRS